MDRTEIQEKINYYQNAIDNSLEERSKLEQQIEELCNLSIKLGTLKSDFESKQLSRKNGLEKLCQTKNTIKAISSYCSGMNSLLNGTEYNSANTGLVTAQQSTDSKRKNLELELDTVNDNLSSYQNSLD